MFDALQAYWETIVGSTVVAAFLSWFGIDTLKTVRRLDRVKVDRNEFDKVITLMHQRDDQYREDQKEAREGRRQLHQKFDAFAEKLNETNVQIARLAGRLNSKGDGA